MTTTQAVVRDARELIELIVACAPVDWDNAQMRLALDAIMARAIGRGLVWGTDWISCWPQSDGEWIGVLAEGETMYGPEGPQLRPPMALASSDRDDRHRSDFITDQIAALTPHVMTDEQSDQLVDQWYAVDRARHASTDEFDLAVDELLRRVKAVIDSTPPSADAS